MDALLNALAQSDLATYLRFSRWGYAAVNTVHVLGISLLVGAIIPLDLRLFGVWPRIPHKDLAQVLVPAAACGLAIALMTGPMLFSVRPGEYAGLTILWAKMSLVALGGASAIAAHVLYGWWLQNATQRARIRTAAISMICWMGALIAGRMIAFAGS